jgi:methionine sulfoxide reductase heme-binding subunit
VTSPSPLWFIDRSSGEVTIVLMSAVMVVGIIRAALPAAYPFLVEGLHTNLALLTIAFGALHVFTAILDPFASLGPLDALVPFLSTYRATWLGLGVISGYLYGLAIVTSWPARRLRREWWVWLHRGIYLAWALALIHALATGSDARNAVFLVLNAVAVAGVLVAFLAWRVTEGWRRLPAVWAALAVVAVLAVAGFGVWAVKGPLQSGWAKTSGTPPNLLRSP